MANSGAKKVMRANQQRLKMLLLAIGIANVLFLVVRVFILRRAMTPFIKVCWGVLGVLYGAPFYMLWIAARPQYGDDGNLIHGGHDISKPGLMEYAHDVIYIALVTQVGLIFSRWFVFLFLIVPLYLLYLGVSYGLLPSHISDVPAVADDNGNGQFSQYGGLSRKERRQADRKARKQR